MAKWKVVTYEATSQAGPAKAMDALVKDLKKKKIAYDVFDMDVEEAVVEDTTVEGDDVVEATATQLVAGKKLETRG